MDRRFLIASGLAALGTSACTTTGSGNRIPPEPAAVGGPDTGPRNTPAATYTSEELVNRVSDFLGVTAEAAGGAIERIFKDNGRPTGYIAGEEDVLDAALAYAPDIERNCLAHQQDMPRLIAAALEYRCSRLQFFRNVTAAAAAEAKAHGLVRNLFWSDDVEDARRYAALGIDVILTNRAHQLAGRL